MSAAPARTEPTRSDGPRERHEIGDRVLVRRRVVGTGTGGQIVEEWVAYDTLGRDG